MIKTESWYGGLGKSPAFQILLGIFFMGIWVSGGFRNTEFVLIPFLFFINGICILWRLRHLEFRRKAAAAGNLPHQLAKIQPIPSEVNIPVPFTLMHRPTLLAHFLTVFWVWLMVASAFALILPISRAPTFFLLASIIVSLIFAIALLRTEYQQICASNEGLIVTISGRKMLIRWSEARLFAIDGFGKPTNLPTHYELAGPTIIVRWLRLRRGLLFSLAYRSQGPFRDYDRKMEVLLSFIAAKTGLPLYDLR